MTRSRVPQHHVTDYGTFVDDFSNLGAWSVVGGAGTITSDSVHTIGDYHSIKLTVGSAGGSISAQTAINPINFATDDSVFRFWVYLDRPKEEYDSIYLFFSSVSSFSQYGQRGWVVYNTSTFAQGWNQIVVNKDEFSYSFGDTNNSTMIRCRLRYVMRPGFTGSLTFSDLRKDLRSTPKIILGFDDGYNGVYNLAFPELTSRGVKSTVWAIESIASTTTANYMNKAQLTEMHAAGHLVSNHTKDHLSLSTLATKAEKRAQVESMQNWLRNNGFADGADYFCYPVGGYDAESLEVMDELGIKSARAVLERPQYMPVHDLRTVSAIAVSNLLTATQIKAKIDAGIRSGASIHLMLHQVSDEVGDTPVSLLTDILDTYLARGIEFVTYKEWYESLTSPRQLN